MAHLCRLGLGDMTLDDGEHGPDGSLGIHRLSPACEAVRDASYELLARTHRVRLNGRTILLVKSAPNHQGQLGGKVGRVLTCEPVAQSPKNHTEGSPRHSTVHSDFL